MNPASNSEFYCIQKENRFFYYRCKFVEFNSVRKRQTRCTGLVREICQISKQPGLSGKYLRHRKTRRRFLTSGHVESEKRPFLKQLFTQDEALFFDLLDPVEEDLFLCDPGELEHRAESVKGEKKWIIVDEIQKLPRLLDVVHHSRLKQKSEQAEEIAIFSEM